MWCIKMALSDSVRGFTSSHFLSFLIPLVISPPLASWKVMNRFLFVFFLFISYFDCLTQNSQRSFPSSLWSFIPVLHNTSPVSPVSPFLSLFLSLLCWYRAMTAAVSLKDFEYWWIHLLAFPTCSLFALSLRWCWQSAKEPRTCTL